jgi:hypothetical protein
MRSARLAVVGLFGLALPVAAEVRVSAVYGHGLEESDSVEASVRVEPSFSVDLGAGSWFEASARIRFDPADRLDPGRPRYDTYARGGVPYRIEDETTVELRDLYLESPLGEGVARIGRQQVVWGRLDGVRVLDTINPFNFREFILADFDQARIPIWALSLDVPVGRWRVEAVLSPDTTVHDIPERDAWFEFRAPRFRFGADPTGSLPPVETQRPSELADGTIAARLSRSFGRLDVSFQAQQGLDPEPLGALRVDGSGVRVETHYAERRVFGLGATTSVGPAILRAEVAAQPSRHFNTRDGQALGTARADQWTLAGGMDFDGPLDTFVNLQFVYDRITESPPGLVRPREDRIVTVFLRRDFAYETWLLEGRWYGNLEDEDGIFRGRIAWRPTGALELSLAADGFYGPTRGLFGQFSGRDRVSLGVSFTL